MRALLFQKFCIFCRSVFFVNFQKISEKKIQAMEPSGKKGGSESGEETIQPF